MLLKWIATINKRGLGRAGVKSKWNFMMKQLKGNSDITKILIIKL